MLENAHVIPCSHERTWLAHQGQNFLWREVEEIVRDSIVGFGKRHKRGRFGDGLGNGLIDSYGRRKAILRQRFSRTWLPHEGVIVRDSMFLHFFVGNRCIAILLLSNLSFSMFCWVWICSTLFCTIVWANCTTMIISAKDHTLLVRSHYLRDDQVPGPSTPLRSRKR